jgi:hypothetical protein
LLTDLVSIHPFLLCITCIKVTKKKFGFQMDALKFLFFNHRFPTKMYQPLSCRLRVEGISELILHHGSRHIDTCKS